MNPRSEKNRLVNASVIIRIVIWIALLPGGAVLGLWWDLSLFKSYLYSPLFHLATFIPGLVLLRMVFRISRSTGRILARYGRDGELLRLETNRLVTQGPYGCMRHPMHFGLLFFPLAFALLIGSPSFILFIVPMEMLFMLVMIRLVEEPEAVKKFGADYLTYRQRVPMFNLRLSCLKTLLTDDIKPSH